MAKKDAISTLAMIGVPAYVVFRLLTGGWTFAVLLLLICGIVGVFYIYALAGHEDDLKP